MNDAGSLGSQLPMSPSPTAQVITVVVTPAPLPATATPLLPANTPVPPTAVAAPRPVEPPVTMSGRGQMNTLPFTLVGGNYSVSWQVSANSSSRFWSARLASVDTDSRARGASIGSTGVLASGTNASGQTVAYNLSPGGVVRLMSAAGAEDVPVGGGSLLSGQPEPR
jgi:hypothetical protein